MQNSLDEGLVAGVPTRKKFPGKAANVMYQRIEAEFHSRYKSRELGPTVPIVPFMPLLPS
jgi:hypothetical protein